LFRKMNKYILISTKKTIYTEKLGYDILM